MLLDYVIHMPSKIYFAYINCVGEVNNGNVFGRLCLLQKKLIQHIKFIKFTSKLIPCTSNFFKFKIKRAISQISLNEFYEIGIRVVI